MDTFVSALAIIPECSSQYFKALQFSLVCFRPSLCLLHPFAKATSVSTTNFILPYIWREKKCQQSCISETLNLTVCTNSRPQYKKSRKKEKKKVMSPITCYISLTTTQCSFSCWESFCFLAISVKAWAWEFLEDHDQVNIPGSLLNNQKFNRGRRSRASTWGTL